MRLVVWVPAREFHWIVAGSERIFPRLVDQRFSRDGKNFSVGGVLIYRSRTTVHSFIIVGLAETNCSMIRTSYNRTTLRGCRRGGNSFSITVLSIVVPNVSNFRIYGRLEGHGNKVKVVVLSTGARRVSGMAKLVLNTSSCIAGPFSPDRLLTEISSLCEEITLTRSRSRGGFGRRLGSNRFALGLHGHTLVGDKGVVRLARIRFRVVRCFFSGPNITLSEVSVLGRM